MAKTKSETCPGSTLMGTIALASTSNTSCFSPCTIISHDSSIISAITLDDALCSSEFCRFDPTLESLKEQKWIACPGNNLAEEELRLPYRNVNRFSSNAPLEGRVDTALCAKPQRKLSYMSSSSINLNCHHHHRTSTCSSSVDHDYRSSKHFCVPANFFLEEEILDIHSDNFDHDDDERQERMTFEALTTAKQAAWWPSPQD